MNVLQRAATVLGVGIKGHRQYDDQAGDNLLVVSRNIHQHQTVNQDPHDDGANNGAADTPVAAHQ